MATPIYGKSGNIIGYQTSGSRAGSSNYYNYDESGNKVVNAAPSTNKSNTPAVGTTWQNENGVVYTQEKPWSVTYSKPKTQKTTATTKDGQSYTFEGNNWVDYANKNGLDVGSLATAITYPGYVDATEANRFLNEQADRYGVDLNNPIGAYEDAVNWEYAINNNLIPDYNTPFASAAAGQTETNYDIDALNRLDQAYLDAMGSSIKIPMAQGGNVLGAGSLNIGTNNSNINNIVESLGGTSPGTYQGFDYKAYFDEALKKYEDSLEAQRLASKTQFDEARALTNDEYSKAAQQAYIANRLANKKTQEQLLESGIKSGLTESSLMQGNANFENAYNQNELARIAAMRDIDMQNAVADANYSSQLASYIGNLLLQEAQMGQSENAAANEYAWNQYMAYLNQANADREYALQLQQLEYDRQQDAYNKTLQEIELAYQLGDLERLKALGYDTALVEAQIQSEINKLTPKYVPGPGGDDPKPGDSGITTPTVRAASVASDIRRMYDNNSTKQEMAAHLVKMISYGLSEDDAIKIAESYGINLE